MSSTKSRTSGKPKNRFTLCCFCVGSSNSEADLSVQLDNDRCDYVVEKLAIKKVPIALFATDEDLAEMRANSLLDKYNKYEKSPPKEAEALISSYYAMIKRNEGQSIIHKNLGLPKIPKNKFTNTVPEVVKKKEDKSIAINTENTIQEACEDLFQSCYNQSCYNQSCYDQSCYNQIVKADVHEEPGQRIDISPELRQTLEVLGTKQPGIRVNMKHKRSEYNIPPVDVYSIKVDKHNQQQSPNVIMTGKDELKYHHDNIIPGQSRSIPIVKKPTVMMNHVTPTKKVQSSNKILKSNTVEDDPEPRTYPSCSKKVTKKVISPRKYVAQKPDGIVIEQDCQTRLTCQQLDSLINGDAASKSSSQKWKIIIKERERETTTTTTTTSRTSTTTSTSSESEDDENTTE